MSRGTLIVFSGPSGVGKGTVLKEYMKNAPNAAYSVSATTRAPRPGEEDGKHYFFLSRPVFEQMIAQGEMLEHAVYNGNYYGTPAAPVMEKLAAGTDVVLEIEVQGAMQIQKRFPDALLVFVMPPSFEELRDRLTGRGTEPPEQAERRLAAAKAEISCALRYDYIIINDRVEDAAARLDTVIRAARHTSRKLEDFVKEVLEQCSDPQ